MLVKLIKDWDDHAAGEDVNAPDAWSLCLPDDAYVVYAIPVDEEAQAAVEKALAEIPEDQKRENAKRRMARHAERYLSQSKTVPDMPSKQDRNKPPAERGSVPSVTNIETPVAPVEFENLETAGE